MHSNQPQPDNTLQILDSSDVSFLLKDKEKYIVDVIQHAYEKHHLGLSSLPHSVFLRFPENSKSRIIGLPAYLGGEEQAAGFKWVASFPDNLKNNLDRASALMIINCVKSGYPKAVIESSIINAKRTAASAALASTHLLTDVIDSIGLIGCGLIGFEIFRFMKALHPLLDVVYVHDLSAERAQFFKEKVKVVYPEVTVKEISSVNKLFEASKVVALATTSPEPYINDVNVVKHARLILNISLRDLSPNIIMSGINIVDDVDHVCREKTSIHLAETMSGNREFIHGTLAELVRNEKTLSTENTSPVIFSPFGLGVLDLALAEYLYKESRENGVGSRMDNFFPKPWQDTYKPDVAEPVV